MKKQFGYSLIALALFISSINLVDAQVRNDKNPFSILEEKINGLITRLVALEKKIATIGQSSGHLHVYDANGQDLGYVIGRNAAYNKSLNLFINVAENYADKSVYLGAGATPSTLYYENANCIGTPLVQGYADALILLKIDLANNEYFALDKDNIKSRIVKSTSYPNVNESCNNNLPQEMKLAPIVKVTLPFTLPLAYPLSYR